MRASKKYAPFISYLYSSHTNVSQCASVGMFANIYATYDLSESLQDHFIL